MKIQCLMCKEIVEIGPFVTRDGGIEIRCTACTASFFLHSSGRLGEREQDRARAKPPEGDDDGEGAGPSEEEEEEAAGDEPCPKCGAGVRAGLAACKACGLLRDRFASFAAEAAAAEADPALEELWSACESAWDDPDRHEAFVGRASKVGAYALAARRYREAKRARPGDPIAAARLERITKMAEVALLSARPEVIDEGTTAYRGVIAFLVILLAVGAAAGIYAATKKSSEPGQRPPAARPVGR